MYNIGDTVKVKTNSIGHITLLNLCENYCRFVTWHVDGNETILIWSRM